MSLLLTLACLSTSEPEPKAKPSVLLVTLDTTRADALGAYGHAAAQTPVFDGLSAQGARFDRAFATVPLTTPSHASMLTGLYPTRHGVHNNGDAILKDEVDTLAELLGEQGYRSAASVSAFVTTSTWNLDQGFDAYFDEVEHTSGSRWEYERPGDQVVDDLLGWLPTGEAPFFAWAHFYDAHAPYQDYDAFDLPTPYDEEIAFVDQQLGRLVEAARAQAGEGGLVVVVVADHGEAFGEHGEHGHGMFVYNSTMRIPMIVVPPEPLAQGQVIEEAVSNVDVTPTILGLLGVAPKTRLDGVDLSPALSGTLPTRGPVYMEADDGSRRFGFHPELAIASGAMKLFDTPQQALYDLSQDLGEKRNIAAQHPQVVADLHAFREAVWAARESGQDAEMSPALIEQLAALGYVVGQVQEVDYSTAPDAKANMDIINAVAKGQKLLGEGKAEEALAVYEQVVAQQPDLGEALAGMARAQGRLGDHDAAEDTWRRAIELQPESTFLRTNLAQTLASQGHLEEGYAMMRSVHEQVPGDELARVGMLKMGIDLDRFEETYTMGSAWLAEDPDQNAIQAFVGIALVHLNRPAEAEPLLTSSLQDGLPRQLVHLALATIAASRGDLESARKHYQAELDWFPERREAALNLGRACMSLGDWDCAAESLERYAKDLPKLPVPVRLMWAQAAFNQQDYAKAREILDPALKGSPGADVLLLQANLLAKEGRREQAQQVFDKAQALKVKELEAAKTRAAQKKEEADSKPLE